MQGSNIYKEAKIQLVFLFILILEFFKSFFVVVLVFKTDPHVEITVAVPAGVTGLLTDKSVVSIISFVIILRIIAPHANLCLVTHSIPFLDIHLYVSRTPRRVVVKMVVIKIRSITFFIKLLTDPALLITSGRFVCNQSRIKT